MAKKNDYLDRLRKGASEVENKLLTASSGDSDAIKILGSDIEKPLDPPVDKPVDEKPVPPVVDKHADQGVLSDEDDALFSYAFEKYLEKMSIKDKTVTVPLSQRQHNIIRFIAAMNQSTINSVIYNITEEFIQKFGLEDFYDKAQRKFNRSYKS